MKREEIVFAFSVTVAAAIAFGCLFVRGDWLPGANHYEAAARGTNCAIVRLLEERLKERVQEMKVQLHEQKEMLKKRRLDLVECGKSKGVALNGDETLLAEVCGDEYDAWISPSYRYQMLSEDFQEARSTLLQATNQLRDGCYNLPKKNLSEFGKVSKTD
jgi:hypothetical protein